MPPPTRTTAKATTRRPGRPRKDDAAEEAAPLFQAPEDDREPKEVNGQKVISNVAEKSPLGKTVTGQQLYFHGRRVLTLEDGTVLFGCADCPQVTGAKGDILRHRAEVHGQKLGGNRGTGKHQNPFSETVLAMPVGQLLVLAGQFSAWEETNTHLLEERDTWRERALNAEKYIARVEKAMARIGFKLDLPEEGEHG